MESVPRQWLRPVEAVVSGPSGTRLRAVNRLGESGIRAEPVPTNGWAEAARRASSTWVAVRTGSFTDPAICPTSLWRPSAPPWRWSATPTSTSPPWIR